MKMWKSKGGNKEEEEEKKEDSRDHDTEGWVGNSALPLESRGHSSRAPTWSLSWWLSWHLLVWDTGGTGGVSPARRCGTASSLQGLLGFRSTPWEKTGIEIIALIGFHIQTLIFIWHKAFRSLKAQFGLCLILLQFCYLKRSQVIKEIYSL